jgi:XTP/dITP diphosphohydrolase
VSRTLVIATTNRGKLVELSSLLSDLPVDVRGVGDLLSDPPTVIEDGATFAQNALKKARVAASATRCLALADDSGLEVDALGGRPGVRSARFAGEDATDAQNIEALLAAIARTHAAPPLRARFRCVLAVAAPEGLGDAVWTVEGVCEGTIANVPRGAHGFGYDPIFVVAGTQRTMAELVPDEKNAVSHRARALALLRPLLAGLLARSPSE